MSNINYWNNLIKDEETNVNAIEGDLVFNIGGYAFLVQRKNDFNNIFVLKTKETFITIKTAFIQFVELVRNMNIQYIRVEGKKSRYNWLYRLCPLWKGCEILQEENVNRNIFYIKLF